MTLLTWFLLLWVLGTTYGFSVRWYDRNHRPHRWNRRFDGVISLSDRTTFWLILLWPLFFIAGIVGILLLWILATVEPVIYKLFKRHTW